jgi:hypothetical protein
MPDDLSKLPTSAEIADALAGVKPLPEIYDVLRRLAFERDDLRRKLAAYVKNDGETAHARPPVNDTASRF